MPPLNFLLLPRELRDHIYMYAVTIPDPIHIELQSWQDYNISSLTYANHQVHDEISSILYSKNLFLFSAPQCMKKFLARIGKMKTFITSIGILVDCTDPLFPIFSDLDFGSLLWKEALLKNKLHGLKEMLVWGCKKKGYLPNGTGALMNPELEETIKSYEELRKLTLKGFEKDERRKFYKIRDEVSNKYLDVPTWARKPVSDRATQSKQVVLDHCL